MLTLSTLVSAVQMIRGRTPHDEHLIPAESRDVIVANRKATIDRWRSGRWGWLVRAIETTR